MSGAQRGGAVEARVSIGEALAEARGQAGLTVTEVSRRTHIRETIIRGIECGNYSACGGDFYARGNIRSIAKVVGADPEPLIREYDAVHRAPGALSAVSLDELVMQVQTSGQRRLKWTTMLGLALVVTLGFAAYNFISGSPQAVSTPPKAANHVVTDRRTGGSGTPPAPKTSQSATPHVHPLVVHLAASRSCWVVFSTRGGRYLFRWHVAAGASNTWTFRHAVELRLDNPSSITLTVDGKNPLPPGSATGPVTLILRPDRPAAVARSRRHTVPTRTLTGPAATVRAYVAAINGHHYARAWSLGGRNTGRSYSRFVSGFSTTARDTLTVVSVAGDVVTARITAHETDGTVNTYQGTYTVDRGVIVGFDVLQVG
jgi:transcriptional regulator with XRE-family HTH domain